MDLDHHERPSQRVIKTLGGGSYFGRHAMTGEPCLLSDDEDALETFSNFAPCWMNNLYEEQFDKEIAGDYAQQVASFYDGRPPQAYSLHLREQGVEEFCQCTMAKPRPSNAENEDENENNVERKQELLNNLARDGMNRLYDKFQAIQKRVAYSVTSREMSGFTTRQLDRIGDTSKIKAQTTLTYCMPSEMTKLLSGKRETGGPEERLCGERGVRRLAEGMGEGTSFDCQFDVPMRVSKQSKCRRNSMDVMNLEKGFNPQVEILRGLQQKTGARDQNRPSIHGLSEVLLRHQSMADLPYKTRTSPSKGQPRMVAQRGGDLEFSRIGDVQYNPESVRDGGYSKSMMEMLQQSRQNEFSEEGRILWERNNSSIRQAFESALSSSGKVSQQAINDIDVDRLMPYLQRNPYLQQRLLSAINSNERMDLISETKLRKAVKTYVEKDLYRAYKTLGSPEDYDLSSLMGISYGPEYYETLNECEEIQKTMISLCRALDQEEGKEKLGHFFTDARLMDLYADDLNKMQKGEASRGAYRGFSAASHYFCEEAQSEGSVEQLNENQRELEVEFAVNSIFTQMEKERQVLHQLSSKDQQLRRNASKSYTENSKLAQEGQVVDLNTWSETVDSAQRDSQQVISKSAMRRIRPKGRPESLGPSPQKTIKDEGTSYEGVVSDQLSANDNKEPDELKKASSSDSEEKAKSAADSGSVESGQYDRFQNSFNYKQSLNSKFISKEKLRDDTEEEYKLKEQNSSEKEALQAENLESLSPVEKDLMEQLESMRDREDLMMEQLEKLSKKMEKDRREDELEKKQEQVTDLRNQMQDLKKELSEVKQQKTARQEAPGAKAKVKRKGNRSNIFGTSSKTDTTAARDRPAPAISRTPETASPASSSLPSGPRSVRGQNANSSSSSGASFGNDSNLSSGPIGPTLTGTNSQSAARVQVERGTRIAPPDMSMTSLALNADGNTAFRETSNPGLLERVVFETKDGEIVYKNGHPVVAKRESVNVEETLTQEAMAKADEELKEDAPTRAPASVQEEMLEIERELRPRASHQELIETLQQNTEN